MFERLTDRARRVMDLAQDEARRLQHHYIGTEHLLLGLLGEGEGIAAQALQSLGIGLAAARQQVEQIVGRGQQAAPEHIPFTPRAKKVLGLARREALQLGHHYIGTEHILLGLIREGDGVAAQALAALGAELNPVRQQVIRLLHGTQGTDELAGGRGARQRPPRWRHRGLLPEVLDRVESIDAQLSVIGQRLGTGPEKGDASRSGRPHIQTLPLWPGSCTGWARRSGSCGTCSASKTTASTTAPPDHLSGPHQRA